MNPKIGVREHARGRRPRVGGVAAPAALCDLPVEAHRERYDSRISRPDEHGPVPDRNLALELVRVTEAAAMGAGRWIGRGDKNAADQAAVDAMRAMLDTVAMDGVVVIGEGEKDEAPMLYNGERGRRGRRPRGRRRRRPARGHAPDRARPAERDRRDRGRRARLDVLPGRAPSTWRRSRPAPTRSTRSTSTRRRPRT